MKKKELTELHTSNTETLNELLKKTQLELVKKQLELHMGKVKNWRLLSSLRREIAQVQTIMNEKAKETK